MKSDSITSPDRNYAAPGVGVRTSPYPERRWPMSGSTLSLV